MILANPKFWFPWVDQVDRPYFIAIDKLNNVYAEFTDLDEAQPVTARGSIVGFDEEKNEEIRKANWYENVGKDNLKYFIIMGRFGWYYLELSTGLIYACTQHKEGDHPIQTDIFGLQIFGEIFTGKDRKFKLKHFKTSDVSLMGSKTPAIIRGMHCDPSGRYPPDKDSPIPFHASQTSLVSLGWEVRDEMYGRITFEAGIVNRAPEFFLRILYTPNENLMYHEKFLDVYLDGRFQVFNIIRFNVRQKKEFFLPVYGMLRKGELMEWQHQVL